MTFFKIAAATAAVALLAGPALAKKTKPAPAPVPAAAPAVPAPPPLAPATANALDTLKARGNFTTFLKLIDAAGLTDTINGLQAITLFAPTDAAFAALNPGIVDGWMAPDHKEGLQRLLLYHVINAKLTGAQIVGKRSPVPTGASSSVVLDGTNPDGKIRVDAATATEEVQATNGEIFIVDKVLAPR
jgi:uncharacterized surface protein with fasciclin (FAS1) repeats